MAVEIDSLQITPTCIRRLTFWGAFINCTKMVLAGQQGIKERWNDKEVKRKFGFN